MHRTIQLNIDNPCRESWDGMSPSGDGRFCAACQKTVVDFTEMSDPQLLQWLARPRHVCGRFHQDQLNRYLAPEPRGRRSAVVKIWQYMLAGLLLSTDAPAQTAKPAIYPTQQQDSRPTPPPATPSPVPADTLRGQIRDTDGKPVPFATVMFNEHHGVIADDNGRFAVSTSLLLNVTKLTVSAIGYKSAAIPVNAWAALREQVITLQMNNTVMGDLIVVGKVTAKRSRRTPAPSIFKDTLSRIGLAPKPLTIYPNPVARGSAINLSLRLDTTGTCTVQLFTLSGILEGTIQIEADAKSRDVRMDIPASLSAGAYFIRLASPGLRKVYTEQIRVF